MYGVANLSVIPMRAEPSEKSEMVSQLLFGDAYTIIAETTDRFKIRTCDCNYEGWIDKKQHNPLHEKDIQDYLAAPKYVVSDYLFFIKTFETNIAFPIFIGSSFPFPKDGILILGNSIFMIELPVKEDIKPVSGCTIQQVKLMRTASLYLQSPYLWGGRTPAGIDCSGFTQMVFKSIDVQLPRDAAQQVICGATIDFVTETQIGDLAFFQNETGNIVHVGIVCGAEKIIHASGRVRIDKLDSTGIFCHEQGKYSHNLRIIKRLIN